MAEVAAGAPTETLTASPAAATNISPDDEKQFQARIDKIGEMLKGEPRKRVRISKELWGHETFVGINGYRFQIQNGVNVEVPETVEKLLIDMGRI